MGADGRRTFGCYLWINSMVAFPIPQDEYYMAEAGSQKALITPFDDLVAGRQGHHQGSSSGDERLKNALTLVPEAVPESAR